MVSSEVAAACVAAAADLVRALSVLTGRVDTTLLAVGEAITAHVAAEATFRKQLYAGLGHFGVDPTQPSFGAHDFTSASGGEGPW